MSPVKAKPLGKRLLWFAGLWVLSVLALGVVALAIKWMLANCYN